MKKILLIALVVFVAYYVLHSPQVAGKAINTAGRDAWEAARSALVGLTKFVNTIFSGSPGK
ncbi:MAG: hypothetical protein NVSMB32_07080 [Actinomycetota bacterium]